MLLVIVIQTRCCFVAHVAKASTDVSGIGANSAAATRYTEIAGDVYRPARVKYKRGRVSIAHFLVVPGPVGEPRQVHQAVTQLWLHVCPPSQMALVQLGAIRRFQNAGGPVAFQGHQRPPKKNSRGCARMLETGCVHSRSFGGSLGQL